ncbi:hypothetical protein L3Y34_002150 [Caenorhabditis briggsae]|uniref:Uncharacterized protein n=1 Tax=Caenorhabditis briggsae TaxID=6238 RepID=A0AAE9DE30_CAEBR|nr:hypothetical protein L3Y34_002150 [Caenorhabditis briggsae]
MNKHNTKVIFFYLLPSIILESAYALKGRAFIDNIGTILLYAVLLEQEKATVKDKAVEIGVEKRNNGSQKGSQTDGKVLKSRKRPII